MEVINDGLTVLVDLRGRGNAMETIKQGADELGLADRHLLFELISLAAIASCQVRYVAGVKTLVIAMVVRSMSRDIQPIVEEGNMVIGKMVVWTPMNRMHTMNNIMTVNHVLPSPEEAGEFYLGMVRQMEEEVRPARDAARAAARKIKSSRRVK